MKVPKQPEVNIGMVGHVDHGKTTLTQSLTGEWTDKYSEEIKRGVSIKLGYADAVFYKCPKCSPPENYSIEKKCPVCKEKTELQRVVSFVDSPGHETLMATMLSGAAIMDGALLLIAANEPCPQPQTKEHLMALTIVGIKNIVIVQNKVDLVSEEKAIENYNQIKEFVKGTIAEKAPIIPASAQQNANIDSLIMAIEKTIPTPKRVETKSAKMYIARSFDINKPGTPIENLQGGVIGGSLIQGSLEVGEEIEIRPGIKIEERGKIRYEKIIAKITSLYSGGQQQKKVSCGGLIAIGTLLDPSMTKSDALVGRIAGKSDALPDIFYNFTMKINLLERVIGSAQELKVEEIKTREPLMLNAGVATTVGIVTSAREKEVDVSLKLPICAEKGQRIAISRRVVGRWRLIGYGIIK